MTFTKQPITVQILDFAPTLPTHERNIILNRLKVLGEAIFKVPSIAKSQLLFNQLPLDLSKLLIKRRNKESNEFIVLYHDAKEMSNVASPQIMSLYSDLQAAESAVSQ
jgi:hypothetical protein